MDAVRKNRFVHAVRSALRLRTLADGLAQGHDNFLLLRLVAATMVIYGHGPAISADPRPDLFVVLGWGSYSGDIAVDIFFAISGFMIAGSYLRRRHLFDFLWARALRIYPAYILCMVATAYLLGAVYTTFPLASYFHSHETTHYVIKNLALGKAMAWQLPGVFMSNPGATVVNGSIWTLPAEVRMYLWVAIAGISGVLTRRSGCNLLIVALFACGWFAPAYLPLIPLQTFLRLAAYFALGVFCYVNRDGVPLGWPIAMVLAVVAGVLHGTLVYPVAFGMALTAFVFAFAYALPDLGFNRFGDYSYGLYLWGFPAQQVVVSYAPHLSAWNNSLIAWLLAMLVAMLSWHLVEKPALKLKRFPHTVYATLRGRLPARAV